MDSLITFLVVLIVSAIGTWIKRFQQKQKEAASDTTPVQPGQPRPVPRLPQRPIRWEDELRRLLGDEDSTVRPRDRPTPPVPPIVSRPIIPPSILTVPTPAQPPPVVARVPAPAVVPRAASAVEHLPTGGGAPLAASRKADERVSHFDKIAAERIKRLPTEVVKSTSFVQRTELSPEALQALSLVRNARAAREAMIASIILGPPKALEVS